MDRIDAMRIFVSVLDEGSLAGAARALKRSPAAISRALAFLEAQVGVELLHRTTRTMRLSEAGERYATACRRILADLEEAEILAGCEKTAPRGVLTISAPPIAGEDLLQQIISDFVAAYPEISVKMLLLDRPVNLVEEGVDVALRVAQLPDSSLIATKVGDAIRRVVVAAPSYLEGRSPIETPADLEQHDLIAFTNFGLDSWTFAPGKGGHVPRTINFQPRLTVNSVRFARAAAIAGSGVTRLYCYHVADAVERGELKLLLTDWEMAALPVHLITPAGRASVPKVRAFLDFAAPRLRAAFNGLGDVSRQLCAVE